MDRKKALSVLGLDSSASEQEIKDAYRKLAKECHPDRNPGCKKSEAKFKELSVAYTFLKDNKSSSFFNGSIFDFIKTQEKARDAQKDTAAKKEDETPAEPQVPAKREGFTLEDALDLFRTVAEEVKDKGAEGLGVAADRVSDVLLTKSVQDGARSAVNGVDALLKAKFGINALDGAGDKVAGAMYSAGKNLKKRGPGGEPGQGPKP